MKEKGLNLFLVETKGLGDFYVVEKCFSDAKNKLDILLSQADYGFRSDRLVTKIKLISQEIYEFPNGKPFFSSDDVRLILPTTYNNSDE